MAYQNSKGAATQPQGVVEPVVVHGQHTTVCQCLVVSADAVRRDQFEQAALDTGWKVIACDSARDAAMQLERNLVQLAAVDMQTSDDGELPGGRALIEQLATDGSVLLVVCGSESRPDEEIWARQVGAWLFLPGISTECDLAMLCEEARHIASRLGDSWKPWPPDQAPRSASRAY